MPAPRSTRRLRWAVIAVASSLFATGCVWTYEPPAWSIHAELPPPLPHAEFIPPSPGPGYVWIDGYWHWNGVRYIWLRGHWSYPPIAGYLWAPSGWILIDGRYHFYAGRWVHPGHRPPVVYHRTRVPPRPAPAYRAEPRRPAPKGKPATPSEPARKARPD